MTLPSGLTEPLGWVGLEWPQADEELLFEAGQQWLSFAQDLTNLAQDADTTAARVWQINEGETSQAFETWWTRDQGPQQRLNEDAQAATLIGQALMVFAAITLALKINFIVQLVILAIEVAQAIATAFVSFGATTAEVPGFVAATRLILRRLIREVVQHVTTSIKTIFQRAQHLLRKVASRRGSHAATDAARHTPGIPGPMTVRRFEGKSMLKKYRYETLADDPRNPFDGIGVVRRLTPDEREAHRLFFDEESLLRKASDGTPFDTMDAMTEHSRDGGRAIFVMDEQGNLYASTYQRIGDFHHSTLADGREVASAGEIAVTEGKIQHVTSASGHYHPGVREMQNLADELARNGLHDVPILDFFGQTRLL